MKSGVRCRPHQVGDQKAAHRFGRSTTLFQVFHPGHCEFTVRDNRGRCLIGMPNLATISLTSSHSFIITATASVSYHEDISSRNSCGILKPLISAPYTDNHLERNPNQYGRCKRMKTNTPDRESTHARDDSRGFSAPWSMFSAGARTGMYVNTSWKLRCFQKKKEKKAIGLAGR